MIILKSVRLLHNHKRDTLRFRDEMLLMKGFYQRKIVKRFSTLTQNQLTLLALPFKHYTPPQLIDF